MGAHQWTKCSADYAVDAVSPVAIASSAGDVADLQPGRPFEGRGAAAGETGVGRRGRSSRRRASGPDGLELIADTFLSVSTPVQLAAEALLRDGAAVRAAIRSRVRENLEGLRRAVRAVPSW